jgi:hypothetical protein
MLFFLATGGVVELHPPPPPPDIDYVNIFRYSLIVSVQTVIIIIPLSLLEIDCGIVLLHNEAANMNFNATDTSMTLKYNVGLGLEAWRDISKALSHRDYAKGSQIDFMEQSHS